MYLGTAGIWGWFIFSAIPDDSSTFPDGVRSSGSIEPEGSFFEVSSGFESFFSEAAATICLTNSSSD